MVHYFFAHDQRLTLPYHVDPHEHDSPIPELLTDSVEAECVRQLEGRRRWLRLGIWSALGAIGGLGYYYSEPRPVVPLYFNGFYAYAHASHPPIIHQVVFFANQLVDKPYKWGGGHRVLFDNGFDCSGSVSHVLYRAGLLDHASSSTDFSRYGLPGGGRYLTLHVKPGHHVFMEVCGLRFDTSGNRAGEGPRWRVASRSYQGFQARHPAWL